jgi:hypothetical protein
MLDLKTNNIFTNKVYAASLILCLALRILFAINNPILTSDNAWQYEATKNKYMNGQFSNTTVNAENLNIIHVELLTKWPVGLSISVILLNRITNNLLNATILFEIAGSLLLLFGILKILTLFNTSLKTKIAFLGLFAVNNSVFYYSGTTDLFTAALYSWMIYYTLKMLQANQKHYLYLTIISLLAAYAAMLRLACIPNLAIFPFFFLLMAFINKTKRYVWFSFYTAGISLSIIILFYNIFPIAPGRTSFIENIKNGVFFIEHLKWMDPFPLKAFIYTRPIEFRLPNNSTLLFVYRLSLLLLSFGFGLVLLWHILKKSNATWLAQLKKNQIQSHFVLLLICTAAVVIGFITLQSLTVEPEANSFGPSWMPRIWTFVYSTRYFIYLLISITILFFLNYNASQNTKQGLFYSITYLIFLTTSLGYFAFTTYQFYSPNGNGAASEWVNEKNSITAYRLINNIYQNENKPHIVYTHHQKKHVEGLVTNFAFSHHCDDYETILSNQFHYTKKMVLITSLPYPLTNKEIQFLKNKNFQVLYCDNKEVLIRINLS